ncbi:MAG: hypothetical protein AAGD14_09695 [Planctomycetota bacterium]
MRKLRWFLFTLALGALQLPMAWCDTIGLHAEIEFVAHHHHGDHHGHHHPHHEGCGHEHEEPASDHVEVELVVVPAGAFAAMPPATMMPVVACAAPLPTSQARMEREVAPEPPEPPRRSSVQLL